MEMEITEQQKNAAIIQALQDVGCDKSIIEKIMKCWAMGNEKEVLCLLTMHRACLLCKIHEAQKPLDTVDYLIFNLKKKGCF